MVNFIFAILVLTLWIWIGILVQRDYKTFGEIDKVSYWLTYACLIIAICEDTIKTGVSLFA